MHPLEVGLAGERDQRRAVEERVGDGGDEVRGARARACPGRRPRARSAARTRRPCRRRPARAAQGRTGPTTSASDSFRSKVSSPGMPNTYLTPSASRHSTNTSLARRAELTFTYPDLVACPSVLTLAPQPWLPGRVRSHACAASPPQRSPASRLPGAAQAKSSFVIRGAGFGHGIGLSQYGAYGYAQHGSTTRRSSATTTRAPASATVSPAPTIRVLLQSAAAPSFSGRDRRERRASSIPPRRTRSCARAPSSVALRSPARQEARHVRRHAARDRAPAPLRLHGRAGNGVRDGRYRGALEVRAGLFGGVIGDQRASASRTTCAASSAARCRRRGRAAALEAQAVVARIVRDHDRRRQRRRRLHRYPDTRSQMYRGVAAETPSTESAVDATTAARSSPTAASRSSPTSSPPRGGQTENVENSFVGALPRPWLRGVDDPFDSVSPRHRWGPYRMALAQAGRQARRARKGRFRSIKVLQRGLLAARRARPGRRHAREHERDRRRPAPALRALRHVGLLHDDHAKKKTTTPTAPATPATDGAGQGDPTTGGTAPTAPAGTARAGRTILSGTITPARRGAWLRVQRKVERALGHVRVDDDRRARALQRTARWPGRLPRAVPRRPGPGRRRDSRPVRCPGVAPAPLDQRGRGALLELAAARQPRRRVLGRHRPREEVALRQVAAASRAAAPRPPASRRPRPRPRGRAGARARPCVRDDHRVGGLVDHRLR